MDRPGRHEGRTHRTGTGDPGRPERASEPSLPGDALWEHSHIHLEVPQARARLGRPQSISLRGAHEVPSVTVPAAATRGRSTPAQVVQPQGSVEQPAKQPQQEQSNSRFGGGQAQRVPPRGGPSLAPEGPFPQHQQLWPVPQQEPPRHAEAGSSPGPCRRYLWVLLLLLLLLIVIGGVISGLLGESFLLILYAACRAQCAGSLGRPHWALHEHQPQHCRHWVSYVLPLSLGLCT